MTENKKAKRAARERMKRTGESYQTARFRTARRDEPELLQPVIRMATPEDLDDTLAWLKAEYDREGEGFWVNRQVISNCARDGDLTVAVDPSNGEVIGLLCGDRGGSARVGAILAIRPDRRRQGVGTALSKEYLNLARSANALGVRIEVMPRSAEPFWRRLGFERLDSGVYRGQDRDELEMFLMLPHSADGTLDLSGLPAHRVEIRLARDHGMTVPLAPPFDSAVELEESVAYHLVDYFEALADRDHWMEIRVDGNELIKNKVKYVAWEHGIDFQWPFVRVSEIFLPEPGTSAWRETH